MDKLSTTVKLTSALEPSDMQLFEWSEIGETSRSLDMIDLITHLLFTTSGESSKYHHPGLSETLAEVIQWTQ